MMMMKTSPAAAHFLLHRLDPRFNQDRIVLIQKVRNRLKQQGFTTADLREVFEVRGREALLPTSLPASYITQVQPRPDRADPEGA